MTTTLVGSSSQRTNRVLFVLAVLLALVAAVLVFAALSRGGGEEEATAPVTASVVVASHDIPARTKLTEEMMEVREVPPDTMLRGAFSATAPLIGQVTRYPLVQGEQMTAVKVGPQAQEENGLSFVIPPGRRGLAVSVSEVTGVGGLLLPGDMVDVIALLDEGDVGVDKAVTLLQNIEVLAVAQEAEEPVPPPQELAEEGAASQEAQPLSERPEDVEVQPDARTVTLAVTPGEAQLLALAQEKGKLVLALRPFGEEQTVPLGEQTLSPLETR